ncbi:HEAT repeat domain-containing protein [Myxococcota bacterium]|nr:HEAT repeat domain-containing protein [Myxococcota bacterium]
MGQGGFDFGDPFDALLRAAMRLGFERTRGVLRGQVGELELRAGFAWAGLSDEERGFEITLAGASLPSGMVVSTPRALLRSDLVPIGDPDLDGALLVGGDVAEGLACLDVETRSILTELVVGPVELTLFERRLRFFDPRQKPSEAPAVEARIRRVMRLGKRLVLADERPIPETLLDRFRDDPAGGVRRHALQRLCELAELRALGRDRPATPEAQAALDEALASDDAMAHVVAARFLGDRGVPVLLAVIDRSDDPSITAAAIETLGRLTWFEEAEARIVDVLSSATDEGLRRAACEVLGRRATVGAVEGLLAIAGGLLTPRALEAAALLAVAQIQERHGGAPGQLSMTLSDGTGQLSLPGDDEGALSVPEGGELGVVKR